MNEVMIEKYNKLLSSFEKIIKYTKDEELLNSSKESYEYFIVELAIIEKKDINIYVEKMQSLNFEEDIINSVKEKINVSKENNTTKTEEEVVEDKKEEPIIEETIDEEVVEQEIKEQAIEENPVEEPIEEKETIEKEETLEEYIFFNIYRNENQTIGDEFQKIVLKLQADLKNPNDVLIETWVNNYVAFVDKYEKELDKEKMIKYMFELFKKYDKENKYSSNLSNILKKTNSSVEKDKTEETLSETIIEEQKNNEEKVVEENIEEPNKDKTKLEEKPLKILNIKKSFKSPKVIEGLKATAVLGVGGAVLGLPGLIGAGIIWGLHKKGITSTKFKNFLKEHNFTIDEKTNELKDSNGEVITEEKIGKSKYEMLKQYLLKLNTKKQEDGKIKHDYKKNKIASNLLSSKFVNKLKFIKKNTNTDAEYENIEENEEMHKGMGNVR